ncbi:hypothetical protein RvY_10479 [Ramazzottius varieornatus]|uniref:Uncharacterized protein n=1 Tax=Ramazzottius varieornatus TaxID=947166 RepID=A0A1D1VEZ1_RAMVA|nr:hypothetical protein RvY_10479 [Ramazzottius varieornatus]
MLRFLVACTLLSLVAADCTRVEYRLTNYKNPGGVLASGKKCDPGSRRRCDPVIKAAIDTTEPNAPWPGSKPVKQWTKVFEADEKDSAAVNKIVSKDVCTGTFRGANLRVSVDDNDFDHTTPIEQFECDSGREVFPSEGQSAWSTEKSCRAKNNPETVKLMYSSRAFDIPCSTCGQPIVDSPNPNMGRRTRY